MTVNREHEFCLSLMKLIEQNKCIYDRRDAFYTNQIRKRSVWANIARETGRDVEECKFKWKFLRDRFGRELRKRNNCSEDDGLDYREWQYFDQMLFVKNAYVPRKSGSRPKVKTSETMPIASVSTCKHEQTETESYLNDTNYTIECDTEDMDELPMENHTTDTSNENHTIFVDTDNISTIESLGECSYTSRPEVKDGRPLDRLGVLCEQFSDTMKKMEERSAAMKSEYETDKTDEYFMKTIICLMKDLPESTKDKFRSDMMAAVMKLRSESRVAKDD